MRFGKNAFGLSILLVAVAGVVALGGSYAAFKTQEVVNRFTVAEPDVDIDEPGVDPTSVELGTDTKPVKLTNTSASPGYIRARIIPEFINYDGTVCSINSDYDVSSGDAVVDVGESGYQLVFDENWSQNWIYNPKDMYFYYKEPVAAGAQTELLLAGVQIKDYDTMTDEQKTEFAKKYENIDFKVDVTADIAIDNVAEHWGVTLDEDGLITGFS